MPWWLWMIAGWLTASAVIGVAWWRFVSSGLGPDLDDDRSCGR